MVFAGRFLAIVFGYFLLGLLSLKSSALSGTVSPFWPASGLAVGALLVYGFRLLPAVFIGALLTNLTTGLPISAVVLIAAGNSIEAGIAVYLIQTLFRSTFFGRYKEGVALVTGAFVGCAAAALNGALILLGFSIIRSEQFLDHFLTWMGGDLVGALLLGPVIYWISSSKRMPGSWNIRKGVELAVMGIALFGLNTGLFVYRWNEGLFWLNVIVLLFINHRFGKIKAGGSLIGLAMIANYYSLQGYPLFESGDSNVDLLALQSVFVSLMVVLIFVQVLYSQVLSRLALGIYATGIVVIFSGLILFSFHTYNETVDDMNMLVDRMVNAGNKDSLILESFKNYERELLIRATANGEILFISKKFPIHSKLSSHFFVERVIEKQGQTILLEVLPNESILAAETFYIAILGTFLVLVLILIVSNVADVSSFNQRLELLVEERTRERDQERAMLTHQAKLASLGEMSAGIAHEINNPLAVVSGSLGLLEKYREDPEKFKEKLANVVRAVERIEKIVKGLQRFSRSGGAVEHTTVLLNDVLRESLTLIEPKSKRKGVPIESQAHVDLWVQGDSVELEQVIVNLLSNAIDAAGESTQNGKWVKVVLLRDGEHAVFQVTDSGPGVSLESEKKIFTPFFTTKKVGEGTGLGLSISRGILDKHHATLRINRQLSNSCFEVRIKWIPANLKKIPEAV